MLNEEKTFYRNLFTVFSDQTIHQLLVKYAEIEYNKAINGLKTAIDPIMIGRLQGRASVAELFINIRENAQKALG